MRELTLSGFLKQYVSNLSFANTRSIYKLAAEASSKNPRLIEPLFLYTLFSGKGRVLLKAAKSPDLQQEYTSLLNKYDRQSMEVALQNDNSLLPVGYHKVYRSYLYAKNKRHNDTHTKSLMRDRIVQLQREKNISNYRIYTDLKINPGNMNSYIKHGDCSKVSLVTARRSVAYLENL